MTFLGRRGPYSVRCTRKTKNGEQCRRRTHNQNRDCGLHGSRPQKPVVLPQPYPDNLEPATLGDQRFSRGQRGTWPGSAVTGLGIVSATIAIAAWFLLWWLGLILAALFLLPLYSLCAVQRRRTRPQHATDDQEADSV